MSQGARSLAREWNRDRESSIYANEYIEARAGLVLDLVVKHRSIIPSNHRLLTLDIPLDQLTIQIISVSLTLMQL